MKIISTFFQNIRFFSDVTEKKGGDSRFFSVLLLLFLPKQIPRENPVNSADFC